MGRTLVRPTIICYQPQLKRLRDGRFRKALFQILPDNHLQASSIIEVR